jgi:predicted ATPase/DNA-binding SARP family transcriptional activator
MDKICPKKFLMLKISLLGHWSITLNGEPVAGFVSRKVPALLAYLAVEAERAHSREFLAGLLWPEQPENVARKNLRDVLSNLQKVLGNRAAAPPYVLIHRATVQFNRDSDHELDITQFEDQIFAWKNHSHRNPDTCQTCADGLRIASYCYAGDFLEGVFIPDSAAFEDWLVLNRERLRQLILAGLDQLTRFFSRRHEFGEARQYATQQVALAPWMEEGHRQVMGLFALDGQRSMALAQYETCRQNLATELGVPPTESTHELFELIKNGDHENWLPQQFAPYLAVTRLPKTNLPTTITPFFGRQRELTQISAHFQKSDCHLLTLTGPGGIGKTRLAIQVGYQECYNFAQGVFFVSLESIPSPTQIITVLAESLDLPADSKSDLLPQLINYLREKEILLILDNFEHLLDGAALIADLLRQARNLRMLITSRERLNLSGEWVLPVLGLDLPDDQDPQKTQFAAVQLFIQNAHKVWADFSPTGDDIQNIVEICRRLNGFPLAIQLAAAWIRVLSAQEINSELQKLDFLATEQRDLPARHRSLRAVFEHSWDLLTVAEQLIFQQLVVFRGGFTRQAAQQICAAGPALLAKLTDKSFLYPVSTGRFEIHALLKEFAREKLFQSDELVVKVFERHADFYLSYLATLEPDLLGGAQSEAFQKVGIEIDNILTAWDWSLEQFNFEDLGRGLQSLYLYYFFHQWYREGAEIFKRSVSILEAAAFQQTEIIILAKMIIRHGVFESTRSYQYSTKILEAGLELIGSHKLPTEEAYACNYLAKNAFYQGRYSVARQLALGGMAIADEHQLPRRQAQLAITLGRIAELTGEYSACIEYHEDALTHFRNLNDQMGIAHTLSTLAVGNQLVGNYPEAKENFLASQKIWQSLDNQSGLATATNNLGLLYWQTGEYELSELCFWDSITIMQNIGDQWSIANGHANLGHLARTQKKWTGAKEHYELALSLALNQDAMGLIVEILGGFAEILARKDHLFGPAGHLAGFVRSHAATSEWTRKDIEDLTGWMTTELPVENLNNLLVTGEKLLLKDIVDGQGKILL